MTATGDCSGVRRLLGHGHDKDTGNRAGGERIDGQRRAAHARPARLAADGFQRLLDRHHRRLSRPRPGGRAASSRRQGARMCTIAARDAAELAAGARSDFTERGIDAAIVVCDVGNRDEAKKLVARRPSSARAASMCSINNAGVIQVGPLEHMDASRTSKRRWRSHFWGPLQTMLAAIPVMRRRALRPHRQHLVDRREDRRAAPGAVLRQQVRAHRPVGVDPRRDREGRHPRHDRLSRG